ncbi:hypothetical protein [Gallibacterium anatis]|uniref:Uncharacterized protein n=1 Tax=Gallibacterium anatis (strain UMN179) TaxID=1005058 RepID=F4H9I1_GALAU|nr:hypothetical protein [Gallibacterium anatis]AEC18434.1 hypothetical protein UMN179_02427 [Gallibacterium anatis UMN179]KGQ33772.1 hypothetical protein JP34_07945 [Gallibacterium anatis]KGQ41802.1 hypothetical protein JP28_12120 [Gallibacterium anatis]KGQ47768.1 hypothetical protein IO46_12740 [Gallibacterium anatis]KGQ58659.1 hypothetical protein IO45_08745 [Gallibacterium anatis]
MFKKEFGMLSFLLGEIKSVIVIFFILPLIFISVVLGFSTGVIWKYLVILFIGLLILAFLIGIVLFFSNKKWEKEQEAKKAEQAERDKVRYVIIK